MTISSNTLFHFTRSTDSLVGILRNEFKPSYCLEDYSLLPGAAPESPKVAIPMVCFCDIPLSQISEHLATYGDFGIGLSKDWGMKKGVSPVLYAYPGSSTAGALNAAGTRLAELRKESEQALKELGEETLVKLYPLLAHVKPYAGKIFRDDEWGDEVRFYNEREWRYVPSLDDPGPGYGYLLEQDFLDPVKRLIAQDYISAKVLSFDPDDIRYLIIPGDDDILPLRNQLYEIKEKYSTQTVDLLTTRVITAKQILEDF